MNCKSDETAKNNNLPPLPIAPPPTPTVTPILPCCLVDLKTYISFVTEHMPTSHQTTNGIKNVTCLALFSHLRIISLKKTFIRDSFNERHTFWIVKNCDLQYLIQSVALNKMNLDFLMQLMYQMSNHTLYNQSYFFASCLSFPFKVQPQ